MVEEGAGEGAGEGRIRGEGIKTRTRANLDGPVVDTLPVDLEDVEGHQVSLT